MRGFTNFMFGNQPNNATPIPQTAHPSTRGGLPEMIDMLKAHSSNLHGRLDLEKGDKVLLPSSILENILERFGNLPQPLVFSVSPIRTRETTFVGVLEFVAPQNVIILPYWMFKEKQLNEGETVRLGIVERIPKATYLKIRPHRTKFIDLGDPTAILNKHLRDFTVVKKGQTITIKILDEEFKIDVVDIKPENQYNAVLLINADINLDFDAPLDYNEQLIKTNQPKKLEDKPKPTGVRIDNKEVKMEQFETVQNDYDPRYRKIPRGIRKEWYEDKFTGRGTAIGR